MPRVNIYLPSELAASAGRLDINLSALVQEQLRARLRAEELGRWLEELGGLAASGVEHGAALGAMEPPY
ncbi:MAG: type II toxin-antitoxin system CcdA family antitoxin [Candidatus Dormibacteria bacterium]